MSKMNQPLCTCKTTALITVHIIFILIQMREMRNAVANVDNIIQRDRLVQRMFTRHWSDAYALQPVLAGRIFMMKAGKTHGTTVS